MKQTPLRISSAVQVVASCVLVPALPLSSHANISDTYKENAESNKSTKSRCLKYFRSDKAFYHVAAHGRSTTVISGNKFMLLHVNWSEGKIIDCKFEQLLSNGTSSSKKELWYPFDADLKIRVGFGNVYGGNYEGTRFSTYRFVRSGNRITVYRRPVESNKIYKCASDLIPVSTLGEGAGYPIRKFNWKCSNTTIN